MGRPALQLLDNLIEKIVERALRASSPRHADLDETTFGKGHIKKPASREKGTNQMLAAVELGGTSCRVALSHLSKPAVVIEEARFDTTSPSDTLRTICSWLRKRVKDIQALGVASFGPLDLNP